ncbi:MAG: nicotinamide-nucleotide amidohydrolase family protein [Candidatus Omnitrophica bacterium]|nr:nicotinamide-nucleotide amidohydrolase family protein [Candidatus Omnitrophota bacterium]
MQNIAKQVHSALLKSRKTVAVAESCTGGLLSGMLSSLSGSSAYLLLGIVAYSNYAKTKLLKIPASLIGHKGAVSAEVASKMAQSARRIARADFGIGITGIAGPSGATTTKPIGTVYIAIATSKKTTCRRLQLRGSRSAIRTQSALKALQLLNASIHSH